MALRGYLTSCAIGRRISELPEGAVLRLIGDGVDDAVLRGLVVRGVAAMIREEGRLRGFVVA
jgi:hypothetical protein